MSEPTPAPGWYPAPHANNELRFWDGSRWHESAPSGTLDAPPSSPPSRGGLASKRKGAVAIAALIVGILAALTAIVPLVGIIVGLGALALGVIALVKKQSKPFGITGVALGVIAVVVSLIMTITLTTIAANRDEESAPAASQPSGIEAEEPAAEPAEDEPQPSVEPEATTAPEPSEKAPDEGAAPEPSVPTAPDLSAFAEVDDRTFALIAREPDAHAGENIVLYGSIMQFDSATGRCTMLISTAATQKAASYEYEQNVMAVSGDWSAECPVFDPLVEDDHVKIWATVVQSLSYETQIGGNTTVPMIEVFQAELLPATEY